ncbi:helix-turn-helix transcriptional regulator [Kibdelosporangium phytohabitans]|nr:LuxR family transcriptional regulator [Kibdelosporangium phytohabitans]MBE1469761.1 DNA-binding CsgD family transcriptional regulator [Kibdelosporangium phytohabitans]
MELVERNGPWGALARLHTRTAAGQGGVALVTGGMATGKTALLREFTADAARDGTLVLSATGSRAEQSLQLGVMCQILHGPSFPDIPVPGPSVVDSVLWDRVDSDPAVVGPHDAPVIRDMCGALLAAARNRAVVVWIDDIQFVDGATLRVLLYLRRRMAAAPILLILSGWEQRRQTWPSFRAEITRQPHEKITLAALSLDGVGELVTQRADGPAATRLSPACHRLSGGNPLLINALLDDMRDGDLTPRAAYAQAVLTSLHRAGPLPHAVASAVAVLGEHATPALVGQLVGKSTDEVTSALDLLAGGGLLDRIAFRHAVVASTVLDALPPDERSRLHLRAARLLHQGGVGALEIARHLVDADTTGDDWATALLSEAAERALADDDVAWASRCLRLALRDCTDRARRRELAKSLARTEWRVNPAASALHMTALRDALIEGTSDGRDAVTLTRHALWHGDKAAAVAAFGAVTDPQAADELRLACEWLYGTQDDLPAKETGGAPWIQVGGRLAGLMVKGRTADVVTSAEHILQSCQLGDTTVEIVVSALIALCHADRADKAVFWCDTLADEAQRRNARTWQAVLSAARADIAQRQGDLGLAETQACTALRLLPTDGWGVLIGLPRATLLLAYTAMGRLDRAAEVLRQFVPDRMAGTVIGLRWLHARGHYHLASGRPLAALDDFQTCDRQMREWNIDVPALVPAHSDLAQAYLRLDQRKVARDLVCRQLDRPRAISSRTRGTALRVLAATSDLRQRPGLLMEAIEDLHTCGDRLELARALIDLSEAHQELGEFSRARMHARRAAAEAKACRAEPLAKLLSHGGSFDTKDQRPEAEGVPPLSGAERRVATLAARGYSNREIGRMLYITVSTVEQHLTRVYRKLNVGSRADLPVGLLLTRVPVKGA